MTLVLNSETTSSTPVQDPQTPKHRSTVLKWVSIVLAVYLLITAVKLISSGFSLAAGENIDSLFEFVSNPLIALSVGVLATVLTQSSSTTTSVTVGLVAAGMPISAAIPILLGANIGTTVTNTIVALSSPSEDGDRGVFQRSFAAASVHDFFNLLAVAIFLPLELAFGILERASSFLTGLFTSGSEGEGGSAAVDGALGVSDVFSAAMSFLADFLFSLLSADVLVQSLGSVFIGLAVIGISVLLLVLSIRYISKEMGTLMVGKTQAAVKFAISHNRFAGVLSGLLVTSAVQSSSTTTSLAVPLAASGGFSLKQIYPFMVGANIGTTVTALLIGISLLGTEHGELALQAALVHVLFNVLSAVVLMLTPGIREIPLVAAQWAGGLARRHRMLAVTFTVSAFIIAPVVLFLIGLLV